MSLYRLWFGRKYGLIPKSIRPSRRRPRAVRPRLGLTTLDSRIVPAPVMVSASNNGPVSEGAPATIIGVATAGGPGLFYEFDFNNDGVYDAFSVTGVIQHTFPSAGNFPVNVIAIDSTGTSTPLTTNVVVSNVPPTLSNVSITPSVDEGGTVTLTGNVSDPGAADTFTLTVNWGDGSGPQNIVLAAGTNSFAVPHTYLDNPAGAPTGAYTVTATLADNFGGVAQPISHVAGPNNFGYNAYAETSTATRLNLGDPGVFLVSDNDGGGWAPISLGTNTFWFYNTTYTAADTLFVATSGFISFDGVGSFTTDLNSSPSQATIAPLVESWVTYHNAADMVVAKFQDVNGDGTPDQLVVQWTDIQYLFGSPPATFQAVLALNTGNAPGDVVFNDLSLDPSDPHSSGALGAVGIKNSSSPSADAVSVKTADGNTNPAVATGQAIRFTTNTRPSATLTVSVANVPPTITSLATSAASINRGDTLTLTGAVADPGLVDTETLTVNWGDGSTDVVGVDPATPTFTASHRYLANPSGTATDTFTINATAADKDGGVSPTVATSVTVVTPPPVILGLSSDPIVEGQTATVDGTILDNGTNDHFTVAIDWNGDGIVDQTFTNVPAGSFAFMHLYQNAAPDGIPVGITVTNLGGSTDAVTDVVVANVPPTVALDPVAAITEGGTATLSGTITDPGINDTETLIADWGDGSGPQTYALGTVRQFSLGHQYLNDAPGGTYAVTVTATDNGGATGAASGTVAVANAPPANVTLNAGSITEGDTFTLTGGFTDPGLLDAHAVVVTWGDGSAATTLNGAAGVLTFSASHKYLDDLPGGGATVGVTVTDDGGATATATTFVAIANAPPTATPLTGPTAGTTGQSLTFSTTDADPGVLDTLTATWDFGDVTTLTAAADPTNPVTASHAYSAAGSYTVRFTVQDNDGAQAVVTDTVTITASTSAASAKIVTDPLGGTSLVVYGTAGNDSIEITPADGQGVAVTVNGINLGTFAPTNRIIVYGLAGDDSIHVVGGIDLSAWLFGGDGNDRLKGGGGHNVLVGGAGDDLLVGGNDRDILVGGTGADRLVGNAEDDILVAGSTAYDTDIAALSSILSEWCSGRSYAARVANLQGTGTGSDFASRLNGNIYLRTTDQQATTTVFDDNSADLLTGASGQDWYFANLWGTGVHDKITDLSASEFANDLTFIQGP